MSQSSEIDTTTHPVSSENEHLVRAAKLAEVANNTEVSVSGHYKYRVRSTAALARQTHPLFSSISQQDLENVELEQQPQLGPWDTGNISFGGNYGLVAHSSLTIYKDGNYNFTGNFHNPDWVGYNVAFAGVVVDNSGTAFVFSANGSVAGALTKGSQDFNWSKSGANPAISSAWGALVAGVDYKWEAKFNVDVGSLVDSIIDALKKAGTVITAVIAIVG